ncbi:MAG: hypothetical protein U0T82_11880 [Bacteroidales bacterium]|jgi:hypothetical protein
MKREWKDRRECWVIIPVRAAGNKVVRLEHRLPGNVFLCTGVLVSISGLRGFYMAPELGDVSISFNDRGAHPVNLPALWKPYRERLDHALYKLEQPLKGGTLVTGYFKNRFPFEYDVQIYLQCVAYL